MNAWIMVAAACSMASMAWADGVADPAKGPVGGLAQTLEIPSPRGAQRLIVASPDGDMSEAWRVNADLADKSGLVPAATPGYAVSGRVIVQLAGPDGSARGALAGLGGRRVSGAPGFRVIDAGSVRAAAEVAKRLRGMPGVADAYVEAWSPMVLRSVPSDPFFFRQWHLRNGAVPVADANLEPAWTMGYTGAGVTIGITEFGWEHTHPDLAANFNPDATQEWLNAPEAHATACAGVAAAVGNNGLGGAGAAYGARISGQITGSSVDNALAFGFRNDLNHIKSNSWGPPDTGFVASMSPMELAAIADGTATGRDGRGVVFVWAAGNGGTRDRVDYDPYASSRYTIAVGAIGDQDTRSTYNETGSSMFVVAHSDGNNRRIYTADLTGEAGYSLTDYTDQFGGTSSAAPLAAGCIALALQANPQLTWRDVQHLLVHSARKCDPSHAGWAVNGAGHDINPNYGFGAIDAGALVALAQAWPGAGPEAHVDTGVQPVAATIPDNQPAGLTRTVTVSDDLVIESVELVLNVTHTYVGDLRIVLTGPSGTQSVLAEQRSDPTDHYNGYVFTTVRHWDERAAGQWTLNISDRSAVTTGVWNDWKLIFHGVRGAFCAADYNRDGVVDGEDYTIFLGYYGTGAKEADLTGEGEVDFGDYLAFLNFYDGGC